MVASVVVGVSNIPRWERLPMIVRLSDVTMKIAAITEVKRVKKFAPPELPNTVWLDPAKEALISAPLPDWRRTTRTRNTQATIWTTVVTVCIDSGIANLS